jgi:hypothetical protein
MVVVEIGGFLRLRDSGILWPVLADSGPICKYFAEKLFKNQKKVRKKV